MDDNRIARLFTRFAALYGHRWTSQHDDDHAAVMAMKVWREGLDGVTDEQIVMAIDYCTKSGGEWPPSLPTFRSLCVGAQRDRAERARQHGNLLPPPSEYPEPNPDNPVARQFARTLDATKRRIRENYGDDPKGGFKDFLDYCEANGMSGFASQFVPADGSGPAIRRERSEARTAGGQS